MSGNAANTISPQQGGLAGTTVGNVPGAAFTGLGNPDAALPAPKDSVIGDPEVAAQTRIAPLDKTAGTGVTSSASEPTKDAQTILDDLSNSTPAQTATEALSSASATVTSAFNTAATTAQGLANQAYGAVMGQSETK